LGGLSPLFSPRSIAVVGASEDQTKVASIIYSKLSQNAASGRLKAVVYPVNPHHKALRGRRCYPDVLSLPRIPDLLITAVPVGSTVELVEQSIRRGVKAIIIIAGGFGEAGRPELERRIALSAARKGTRILGPNTIGILDTRSGVDTLFLPSRKLLPTGRSVRSLLPPLRGGVLIVTQSGHLGEIVAEELRSNHVGVRAIVGVGNQLDVSVEDVLEHFSRDRYTKMMAVYLEGVKHGRRFMAMASQAAKRKPVVVFKLGKTEAGAKAALTHTASMVGDYQVYRAAFRQAGLVEATSLEELVDDCIAFSLLPDSRGNRMAILTNAGGTGAIAADESSRVGLRVEPLGRSLSDRLKREFGKASFSEIVDIGNPLDLTATATTDEFVRAFRIVAGSKGCDLLLAFPTHQPPTVDYTIVEQVAKIAKECGKPVAVGCMGSSELSELFHEGFLKGGVASYRTPERAVRALRAVAEYGELKAVGNDVKEPSEGARLAWLCSRKGFLSVRDNTRLLGEYGIRAPESFMMRERKDVRLAQERLVFPVVAKLNSRKVIHKADQGAVILDVGDVVSLEAAFSKLRQKCDALGFPFEGVLVQEMVRGGVELMLGSIRDLTFGPTLIFGIGGTRTELLRDYVMAIGKVGERQAMRLMDGLRMGSILDGYRGGPKADRRKVARIVSRFSCILEENAPVHQMEINPLMASADDVVAVDTRTLVGGASGEGPRPPKGFRAPFGKP
jgi:acyl-CoA synthetase (NDP forming)